MQAETELELEAYLGAGGYGTVYSGTLVQRDAVAVKRPQSTAADGSPLPAEKVAEAAKALHREAANLERCAHRHVVGSHGMRGDELTMELAQGGSVAGALRDPECDPSPVLHLRISTTQMIQLSTVSASFSACPSAASLLVLCCSFIMCDSHC